MQRAASRPVFNLFVSICVHSWIKKRKNSVIFVSSLYKGELKGGLLTGFLLLHHLIGVCRGAK